MAQLIESNRLMVLPLILRFKSASIVPDGSRDWTMLRDASRRPQYRTESGKASKVGLYSNDKGGDATKTRRGP